MAALEQDVRAVLRTVRHTAVEELRLQWGGVRLTLRRDGTAVDATQPATGATPSEGELIDGVPPAAPRVEVRAHMVGPFHRSREPDGPVLVNEGDVVEAGRAIGVIETLGLATDVEAPVSGRLETFVGEDGQPVEYGQILAVIATDAT